MWFPTARPPYTGSMAAPSARTLNTLTALVGVLTAIMIGWVLYVGRGILLPLVIALLVCIMLAPVVAALQRWKIPSWATVLLMVVALFLGVSRFSALLKDNVEAFFTGISGEQVALDPFSPAASERAISATKAWQMTKDGIHARMLDSGLPPEIADQVLLSINGLDLRTLATDLLGGGVDFFQGLFLVLIYMLFIFAESQVFRRKILAAAGERGSDAARVIEAIARGVQSYLGVKTVISLATGVLVYVALLFLEVPFALLFGLLAFLLNYIPVFGSIIAGIFPTALTLATSESLTLPVTVASIYVVVNVVMAYLIEPKLFGRELNLSPLVVLVSVIVWSALWGVPGTFLSVPMTATLQIVFANFEQTRSMALLLSSGATPTRRAASPDAEAVRSA